MSGLWLACWLTSLALAVEVVLVGVVLSIDTVDEGLELRAVGADVVGFVDGVVLVESDEGELLVIVEEESIVDELDG